jgi:hypothetical protein
VAQEPRTAQERALELLRATLATSSWLPTTEAKRLVWAIRCAIVLGLLVLIASVVDKTLWDWLQLLIIPAVLAGGGLWFNAQQRAREQQIADDRTQDEALQAYLDKMTELLVVRGLGKPQDDTDELQENPVRTVAWARTKTVLRRLDGNRKGAVLRFLREADLIKKGRPVIRNLSGADLREANLEGSVLEDTALEGVVLRKAVLRKANLTGADLKDADLTGADLSGAIVTKEQLEAAKYLEGATMPNGQKYEDWLKSKGRRGGWENDGPP